MQCFFPFLAHYVIVIYFIPWTGKSTPETKTNNANKRKSFGNFLSLSTVFKIITMCEFTCIVRFSFLIGPKFTNYIIPTIYTIDSIDVYYLYIFLQIWYKLLLHQIGFFLHTKFFTIFFQTLFEPMFIAVYNVFYTSQPVLALGIFDQDVDATHSLKFPKLYAPGLSSALFNKREFFKSALHGFISSCFLFFISHGEIFIAKKVREIAIHLMNLYFIKKKCENFVKLKFIL